MQGVGDIKVLYSMMCLRAFFISVSPQQFTFYPQDLKPRHARYGSGATRRLALRTCRSYVSASRAIFARIDALPQLSRDVCNTRLRASWTYMNKAEKHQREFQRPKRWFPKKVSLFI